MWSLSEERTRHNNVLADKNGFKCFLACGKKKKTKNHHQHHIPLSEDLYMLTTHCTTRLKRPTLGPRGAVGGQAHHQENR